MSGHNKWSKVKNVKGKEDAKKAKIFTKMSRTIMVAVREGGADPEYNASLKTAIEKAKAENMPNDNIERAIKKGAGDIEGQEFVNMTYEGYGPSGVAIIAECLTDNKNRTAGDVRYLFDKNGGNLGSPGSVTFQFDYKGILVTDAQDKSEDDVMMDALDSGADDVRKEDDCYLITSDSANFSSVRDSLSEKGYNFIMAQVGYLPKNTVKVDDEVKEQVLKIIEDLEDHDDVQDVYTNMED